MTTDTKFTDHFLSDTIEILQKIDRNQIELMAQTIVKTRERGGRIFLCGSGGGAGHASHAACDFRKLGKVESYSITDNVSELTARINDEGWDTSYAEYLKASRFNSKDCLFVFSVGGGSIEKEISINLVKAMQLAKEVGASIVGVVGRDGGELGKLGDAAVIVPTIDPSLVTPQTEGLQALIWHLVVSHPDVAMSEAKWESVTTVDIDDPQVLIDTTKS